MRDAEFLELRARVQAVLRRTRRSLASTPRRVGALALDPLRHEARVAGRPLQLAHCEYPLLTHLAAEPERVFTKRELLRDIWGDRTYRTRNFRSLAWVRDPALEYRVAIGLLRTDTGSYSRLLVSLGVVRWRSRSWCLGYCLGTSRS